jgi:hypothetical protein
LHQLLYCLAMGSTEIPPGKRLVALCHRMQRTAPVGQGINRYAYPGIFLRGRAAPDLGIRWACINPLHHTPMSPEEDEARDMCKWKFRKACPHNPHCVWTGPDGERRLCCDQWPPLTCSHGLIMCLCMSQCWTCWMPHPQNRTKTRVGLQGLEELMHPETLGS